MKLKYINVGLKVFLLGLFCHYLLFPDLPQYQNKGMTARLVAYPLAAFSVLIIYSLVKIIANKKWPYPHLVDVFVTLPFAIDMLGNTLDWFNSITWWDDLMHFVLWISWVLAIGTTIRIYSNLKPGVVAGLTLGFGAVSSILWEIGEYFSFVPNNPLEGPEAYRDTMSDEALSLLGSAIGALLISTLLWNIATRKNRQL